MSQLFLFENGKLGKPEESVGVFSGKAISLNSKLITDEMWRAYVYVDYPNVQGVAPEGVNDEEYLRKALGSEEMVERFLEEMDCPDFKCKEEGVDPIMEMVNRVWKANGFPGNVKRVGNVCTGRGQVWVHVETETFEWPKEFVDIHMK